MDVYALVIVEKSPSKDTVYRPVVICVRDDRPISRRLKATYPDEVAAWTAVERLMKKWANIRKSDAG